MVGAVCPLAKKNAVTVCGNTPRASWAFPLAVPLQLQKACSRCHDPRDIEISGCALGGAPGRLGHRELLLASLRSHHGMKLKTGREKGRSALCNGNYLSAGQQEHVSWTT